MSWTDGIGAEINAMFKGLTPSVLDRSALERYTAWKRERASQKSRRRLNVVHKACVTCRRRYDVSPHQGGPEPVHCSRRCAARDRMRRYRLRHPERVIAKNVKRRKLATPIERRCHVCAAHFVIETTSCHHTKIYCSRKCGTVARQRRYLERHRADLNARKRARRVAVAA